MTFLLLDAVVVAVAVVVDVVVVVVAVLVAVVVVWGAVKVLTSTTCFLVMHGCASSGAACDVSPVVVIGHCCCCYC